MSFGRGLALMGVLFDLVFFFLDKCMDGDFVEEGDSTWRVFFWERGFPSALLAV